MHRWFRRSDCARASGMLSAYLDGYLEPRDRAWLERHLTACARCREELASLKATVALLQRLPQVEPRRSFQVGPRPAPVPVPAWGWPALRLGTAVLTVLLVAMIAADVLGLMVPSPAAQPSPPTVAQAASRGPAGPMPEGTQLPDLWAAPGEAQPTPQPRPATGDMSYATESEVTPTPAPVPQTGVTGPAAPPQTPPTPQRLPAVEGFRARDEATPTPAPAPTATPTTPLAPTGTPGATPTAPPATAAPPATSTPQLVPTMAPPTPSSRRLLFWPLWPLQAGLVGVWLALVALTAYRWRVRRKGVRPGQ